MVGNQLMYRYERQQMSDYEQKLKDDNQPIPPMSSVYGASHLVRLFTKLGGCLAYTTMDTDAIEILCKCFDDFVKFLEANYKVYFSVDDYGAAPPEYQRKGKKPFPPQIVDAVA
jgi:mortality factor 4-like protein 1